MRVCVGKLHIHKTYGGQIVVSLLNGGSNMVAFPLTQVHNAQDLSRVMELGSKNRSVGATLMNVDSSRSHSIFTIDIEMVREGGKGGLRAGRLNLVDLAGSERQSKTGSTGDRLKEATKINLSLSALGNVISGEPFHLTCML